MTMTTMTRDDALAELHALYSPAPVPAPETGTVVRRTTVTTTLTPLALRERTGAFRHTDEHYARTTVNRALRQRLARAMREAGVRPSGEAWDTAKRSLKARMAAGASLDDAIAGAVARVS